MAFELDPLYIITIISVSVAAIVGILTIRNEIKKGREEGQNRISTQIQSESTGIKSFISERLKLVDSKFDVVNTSIKEDEKDIKDIEQDMKAMTQDFKTMCDKISKFDFVIDSVLPDFKTLQRDFYKFKSAVDTQLQSKRSNLVVDNQESDEINGDMR